MDLLAANFPKFPTFRHRYCTDAEDTLNRDNRNTLNCLGSCGKSEMKTPPESPEVISTWFLLLFNMCLGPLFCLAALSLSSLSSSLYLSSYPLPLHSRFTLSPPPDKATIVPQMLFNMESLCVPLQSNSSAKMGSSFAALCFTSYFLRNDLCSKQPIWIYMWFSIHSYITSQHKLFCHTNYFNLCLLSRKCEFCERRVCFGGNLVRLLTQLDFGAFDKSQQTSTGIVFPTWTLLGSYLHLQKWSCFCCRWIKFFFF